MITSTLIAQLAIVIAIATFVWLLTKAFNKHTGWGVSVLVFSPVSAIAFGIKHWQQEKIPFLAYLFSMVTAITLCLHLFTSWGGWELLQSGKHVRQALQSHTLTEHDVHRLISASQAFDEQSGLDTYPAGLLEIAERELALQAEQLAAEQAAIAAAEEKQQLDVENIAKKTKTEQQRYRLAYVTIDINDAPNYVGSTVKVKRKNVVEKEYRLIGTSGNRLEFTQRTGSGSYTFKYKHSDIEKLRVLTKQPY